MDYYPGREVITLLDENFVSERALGEEIIVGEEPTYRRFDTLTEERKAEGRMRSRQGYRRLPTTNSKWKK